MKKFLTTLLFLAILFTEVIARGGHVGTFQRIDRDPTGKAIVIEFFIPKLSEKNPAKKKGWRRIIAVDSNGKWDRLEIPIYVDKNNSPLVPQPKTGGR